jgi:tetratricopeptide (TPR) repeat protein
VHLGGGAVALGGTSWAQTRVEVPRAGDYLLRLATPNSVELFVDAESVMRIDRRSRSRASVVFRPLFLSAGPKLITVKLTTRHSNPVISVALTPLGDGDRPGIELPSLSGKDNPSGPESFRRYLRATISLVRGDPVAARQTLLADEAEGLDESPVVLVQAGGVALNDPLVPDEVRRDQARALFRAALKKDRRLWSAFLQLRRLDAENGRVLEAISDLRRALRLWPSVLAIPVTLVELLQEREWYEEADRVIARARKLVPDACPPLEIDLRSALRRKRTARAWKIAEQLVHCDARSNARYAALLQQRRFSEAKSELERLSSLEPRPDHYGTLLAKLELAKNLGDREAVEETLDRLRSRYPRSETALLEHTDWLLAGERPAEARRLLSDAFRDEPDATLELRRVGWLITGKHPLSRFRLDGSRVIERFEASGRSYDQPQVLVFDYMVVRVFEDGSALELIHNIYKVQSDEAVDDLGEFRLPEGAYLLKLQTVKPDGRRIEPDFIAGKGTTSLPNLVRGDYIEYEYVRPLNAPDGFPGGFLGDRFYFRSFEVPFDISHLLLVVPREMELTIDPRGPAPRPEERIEEGLRILSFRVQASTPLRPEPLSVAAREYIPSVNAGIGATWSRFVDSIRDALKDRDIDDPAVRRLVSLIVARAGDDDLSRARALYRWVLRNTENTDDSFSQAAAMLRARTGSRSRILNYLLELAGIPCSLALVRSLRGDATRSPLADPETYDYLLLRVDAGPDAAPVWLSTSERWAPFGFVPPHLRGQEALLLEAGAPRVAVRRSLLGEDAHQMLFDIRLRKDGSASVDAVERLSGSRAVAWRQQLEGVASADLERWFEEQHAARLVPGAALASLQINAREQTELPLELLYSFEVGALGRRVRKGWALTGLLQSRLAASYARTAERTTAEIIVPETDREITLRISLPPGIRPPRLPEDISLRGPGRSAFTLRARRENDIVVLQRNLRLPVMRVEPRVYGNFADFCRKVDEAEAKEMVLSK